MKKITLLVLTCILSSCGPIGMVFGTLEATKSKSSSTDTPSGVSDLAVVSQPTSSPVVINYKLVDPESSPANVTIEFSDDTNNIPWTLCTVGTRSEGISGLATSPAGTSHSFFWDHPKDFSLASSTTIKIRITPVGGSSSIFPGVRVGNTAPSVSVFGFSGTLSGSVLINYLGTDGEEDSIAIEVEYYGPDSTSGTAMTGWQWRKARTGGSEGNAGTNINERTSIGTKVGGMSHVYLWDSDYNGLGKTGDDEAGQTITAGMKIRIRPTDVNGALGPWQQVITIGDTLDIPSVSAWKTDLDSGKLHADMVSELLKKGLVFSNSKIIITSQGGVEWVIVDRAPEWNFIVKEENSRLVFKSNTLILDNGARLNSPPTVEIVGIGETGISNKIKIIYWLKDSESDVCSLYKVEWSNNGGNSWTPCVQTSNPGPTGNSIANGDSLTGLSSSSTGILRSFVWNAPAERFLTGRK